MLSCVVELVGVSSLGAGRALALTRTLVAKTDGEMRTLVVALHDHLSELGFKGHRL